MMLEDQIPIIWSLDQNNPLILKIKNVILEILKIKFLKFQVLINKIDFVKSWWTRMILIIIKIGKQLVLIVLIQFEVLSQEA